MSDQDTTPEAVPSFLDLARQQAEQRTALLDGVEITANTNITFHSHQLNPFVGTMAQFDYQGPAGDGPTNLFTGVPCGLKLSKAVITEAKCFDQPTGGYAKGLARVLDLGGDAKDTDHPEWKWQRQMEFVISLPGAKLGYVENDRFVPEFAYEDPTLSIMTRRALEIHGKTPFTVPEDATEEVREALLNGSMEEDGREIPGFIPVVLTQAQQSEKRIDHWNIQAFNKGGNPAQVIQERQLNGFPISEFTIVGPREGDDTNPTEDFHDFMLAWQISAHRVAVALKSGEDPQKAARMSTVITGLSNNYPNRVTFQGVAWDIPKMGGKTSHRVTFFPARATDA